MIEPLVRTARAADVQSFIAAFGDRGFFVDRMNRQLRGKGTLFFAWLGTRPAGDVYVWLEEAEEPPIRWHLQGVPLLTHLEVQPDLRNRGIGRKLVDVAEQYLAGLGCDRVAMAVRTDNGDAARLYERLGYRDWGHGEIVCHAQRTLPGGGVLVEPERCHVLVKYLTPAQVAVQTDARPIDRLRPVGRTSLPA